MSVNVSLLKKVNGIVGGFGKEAYAPPMSAMTPEAMAPPMPMGGAPMPPPGMPMDPAMMGGMPPPGGMPPMDPAMMGGGMPPMDPAMMGGMMPPPPGMMPPVDPAMMMPPPPMDPAMMMGGMPPIDPAMMAAAMGAPPAPEPEEEKPASEEKDTAEETEVESRLGVIEDMLAGLYQAAGLPLPAGSEGEGAVPTEEVPPGIPGGEGEVPPIPGMMGDAAAEMAPTSGAIPLAPEAGAAMPPGFDLAAGLKEANAKRAATKVDQEKVAGLRKELALLRRCS